MGDPRPVPGGDLVPVDNDPMTWPPPPGREVPEGCVLVWEPEPDGGWLRWTTHQQGNGTRCRYTVGPGYQQCGRPAVAWLDRARFTSEGRKAAWWAYCELHLYGRRVHNGQVWHCVALEVAGDA